MHIQNLFDEGTLNAVLQRMEQLSPASERQWGKMSVAQMLKHCQEAFKVPLSSKPLPRHPLGLLMGWMMKSALYNEKPWKKNLPTAPNFIIKDEPSFELEKEALISMIKAFHQKGAAGIGNKVHPMFGRLTAGQWGKSMWKHLDHHLTQFGV